ncbi:MAG: SDR family oxidoreductase [Thalassotalea sp.]|nr:SDR family oxidoreductase [Thalassotalea sp.]
MNEQKKAIVFGASGKTGRLLVEQLLEAGISVTALARSDTWLTEDLENNSQFTLVIKDVSVMSQTEFVNLIREHSLVYCTLGHNISVKGIWGEPRKLVSNSINNICDAIQAINPSKPIKVILMASTGCRNTLVTEKPPLSQSLAIGVIRRLIPPHIDNELAVENLIRQTMTSSSSLEWIIVRPDTLIDESTVTKYETVPSPVRNAIFSPGQSSRINVANLMSRLGVENELWEEWKGKMPVLYNVTA